MGIKSIWDNPYYKDYQPLPKWSFSVNFESLIKYKKEQKEQYADVLSNSIIKAQWGKREISIVKTYYAGIEANLPGRVQNTGELNLTFNENADLSVSHVLEEIFSGECSDDKFLKDDPKNRGYFYNNEFNKDERTIFLKIHKPSYNMSINDNNNKEGVVAEIEFHNCILVSINEEEFDYSSTDDTLTKTARIAYDYMFWNRGTKQPEGK